VRLEVRVGKVRREPAVNAVAVEENRGVVHGRNLSWKAWG
jgi:hypothetical protein